MEKSGEATGMELILEIVGGETGSSLMNADNVHGCEDETKRVDGFLDPGAVDLRVEAVG